MRDNSNKMLILLQHIPLDMTRDDIADLTDHIKIVTGIKLINNNTNTMLNYAWIELTCNNCTQAGLNAICDVLNHRYFHHSKIQAYPVLFSHQNI